MNELFPEIEPYNTGSIQVSDIHSIYYEQIGNPDGIPIMRIQGGPGGSITTKHRRYYNPDKYRIILFDQRGCGQSTPQGETKDNTTSDLIEDIRQLKNHLQIDKLVFHGGSWGSTLALLYAEKYPDDILGLVLNSIYLATREENEWIYNGGPKIFYPNEWIDFKASLEGLEGANNIEKSYNFMFQNLEEIDNKKLNAWVYWEAVLAFLEFNEEPLAFTNLELKKEFMDSNRIMMHYVKNDMFLQQDEIINNLNKVPAVPMFITHARHDMVCPIHTAIKVSKKLSEAKFQIVAVGGHSTGEENMRRTVMGSMEEMAEKLK